MKTTLSRSIKAALLACMTVTPLHAQQLIDDWLVRTSAMPDALITGAPAVFRNPAALAPARRAEALLIDLRGPDITGIAGMAIAASYRLDARSSMGVGYQHVGVDGIEFAESEPDEGTTIDVSQDLFGIAATHMLSRLQIGAGAQYVRSSAVLNEAGALRLAVGLVYDVPLALLPITIAASAQSQDAETLWSAAASARPHLGVPDWNFDATYGAAGGGFRGGVSHRISAGATWHEMLTLQGGAVIDQESGGHVATAIGSIGVRVNRYELGIVRESLANGFGAVHTFRIGILF